MAIKSKTFKRNFLSNVIFKVDFQFYDMSKIVDVIDLVKKRFPQSKRMEIKNNEIKFDDPWKWKTPKVSSKTNISYRRDLVSADNQARIVIENRFIFLEYLKYKNKNQLLKDVKLLSKVLDLFEINYVDRLWLRYQNILNCSKTKKWYRDYINNDLFNAVLFGNNLDKLNRSVLQSNYVYWEANQIWLRLQTWFYNQKNYPSTTFKPEYLIDIDCYSWYWFSLTDVDLWDMIKEYNDIIFDTFMKSTTNKLHSLMD